MVADPPEWQVAVATAEGRSPGAATRTFQALVLAARTGNQRTATAQRGPRR